MIIGRYLMVQLGLSADLKRYVLQWYCVTVPIKEPRGLIWKTDPTSREICEMLMQTAEPVSTENLLRGW